MKVFRKVTPGANPDITVHAELTKAESEHIAALYGWVEATDPPTPPAASLQLAMLQEFLRTATDGFELALASVRSLFADPDAARASSPAATSRRRRPGSARRCARCTRPCATTSRPRRDPLLPTAELAAQMADRLDAAMLVVPELAPYAAALRKVFGRVGSLDGLDRAAGARRPAPRPDAAHRLRLEDRRLRGRAGQAARGTAAARLALARRRRDAAQLRLRAPRRRARP